MKKNFKILIILIGLFMFNSKAYAYTIPGDGKWYTVPYDELAQNGARGKITECSTNSSNASAKAGNGSCQVKSNSNTDSDITISISFKYVYSGAPGSGTASVKLSADGKGEESLEQKKDNWKKTFENTCDDQRIIGSFKLVGMGITIVKIIVPIIIILYGMWDLFNIIVSGKDDAIKENVAKFIRRLIIGGLVFFAPSILLGLFDFIGSSWKEIKEKYDKCVSCMLDTSKCPNIDLTKDEG